jgi:hypothetical protein
VSGRHYNAGNRGIITRGTREVGGHCNVRNRRRHYYADRYLRGHYNAGKQADGGIITRATRGVGGRCNASNRRQHYYADTQGGWRHYNERAGAL